MRDKEEDFGYFMSGLIKAATRIDPHYFQLPIAGDDPIYRERVYCYELYHQLRCVLGDNFPYKLNGEVDKKEHSVIKKGKIPDFIVHVPGDMKHNLVVIEVKSVETAKKNINGLEKDLDTLKYFLNEADYYRAIMLIYGSSNGKLPENIWKRMEKIGDPRIIVLWHSKPNKKPRIVRNRSYCLI